MVECGGLENRLALFGSRGFESLLLRQSTNRVPATGRFIFGRMRRGFEPEGREKPKGFSRAERSEAYERPAKRDAGIPPPPPEHKPRPGNGALFFYAKAFK